MEERSFTILVELMKIETKMNQVKINLIGKAVRKNLGSKRDNPRIRLHAVKFSIFFFGTFERFIYVNYGWIYSLILDGVNK